MMDPEIRMVALHAARAAEVSALQRIIGERFRDTWFLQPRSGRGEDENNNEWRYSKVESHPGVVEAVSNISIQDIY